MKHIVISIFLFTYSFYTKSQIAELIIDEKYDWVVSSQNINYFIKYEVKDSTLYITKEIGFDELYKILSKKEDSEAIVYDVIGLVGENKIFMYKNENKIVHKYNGRGYYKKLEGTYLIYER